MKTYPLIPTLLRRTSHFLPESSDILTEQFNEIHTRSLNDAAVTKNLYSDRFTFTLQVLAAVTSSISVLFTLVTFYWFARMRKRFRHKLIMFLVTGDLCRNLWYLVFAMVAFIDGPVQTETGFCQGNGYMVQWGTVLADFSAFFIAIHAALQVFRPPMVHNASDGLYNYRHYVYACLIIIPTLITGLAFVNPNDPFRSQGPFCTLPIRPIWYRLALSWGPRYIICVTILSLAIAIYWHVCVQFRQFEGSSMDYSTGETVSGVRPDESATNHSGNHTNSPAARKPSHSDIWDATAPTDPIMPPIASHSRRHSIVSGALAHSRQASADVAYTDGASHVNPERRPSVVTFPSAQTSPSDTYDSNIYSRPEIDLCLITDGAPPNTGTPADHSPSNTSNKTSKTQPEADRNMRARRRAIRRQLRLLFIYPLVYIAWWVFPYILHSMQYSDYYANHPPHVISVLTIFCLTSMGTVDSIVFSLREKPWRHIPSSDGSFLGSFVCWRPYAHNELVHHRDSVATDAEKGRRMRPSFRETVSAGSATASAVVGGSKALLGGKAQRPASDGQRIAAELARVRLAAEQEDRRHARTVSADKDAEREREREKKKAGEDESAGERDGRVKMWWDRRESAWHGLSV